MTRAGVGRPVGAFERFDRIRRTGHTRSVRRRLGRSLVVAALLAQGASWATGWAVALHLASDDHARHAPSDGGRALGLQMAAHGHLHAEGTPAHGHPVVGSVAAPIPGRPLLLAPAMTGNAPETACAALSGSRLAPRAGPNHDPPRRGTSISILRI